MLLNYLAIALRNLRKQKLYGAINVLGLAIGMAGCALIALFVRHELSYDRWHPHAERSYRVVVEMEAPNLQLAAPLAPSALAAALRQTATDIEAIGRVWKPFEAAQAVRVGEAAYFEEFFYWADPELLAVLGFEFVYGDAATALSDPRDVVLSEDTARRYFGDRDPVGEVLDEGDRVVAGVVRDFPSNSHLRFDVLAAASSTKVDQRPNQQPWFDHSYFTYMRLKEGADPMAVAAQIDALVEAQLGEVYAQMNHQVRYRLQPIAEVHLHDKMPYDMGANGDIVHVYAFAAVGLFLLLLAVINFTNLATARSADRALEVGVRKAVGAGRSQLVRQFMGEALLLSGVALFAALIGMRLVQPWFNELTGMALRLDYLEQPGLLAALLGLALFTGLCAGLYPALSMSAVLPARVLKRLLDGSQRSTRLRSVLVVAQFAVSIGLIAATLVIGRQLDYLRSKALGFDQQRLLTVGTRADEIRLAFEPVRQDLLASPAIEAVGRSTHRPGQVHPKVVVHKRGTLDAGALEVSMVWVDYEYFAAMGMEVLEGRAFSRDFADDPQKAFLVNESLARLLGEESAVGVELMGSPGDPDVARIVGVVADFHFEPLYQPIAPLLIAMTDNEVNANEEPRHALIRLAPGDPRQGIEEVRRILRHHGDPLPLDYRFVDEHLEALYGSEEHLRRLFAAFAGVAIFLACLGLFGLMAYTVQQRTKEIGLRKVLGASVASVVALLARDFTRLVLLANVLAWPLVYWAAGHWLAGFAYRTEAGLLPFAVGALLALGLAWGTVAFHAIRAAQANPIESLRYE